MYKSKLQELCQQRAWSLPEYTTTREGPPHKSRFQASVCVNGVTFSSDARASSSKLAQNQAALFAYSHFTSPVHPVNESQSGEETAVQQNAPQIYQSSGSSATAEVKIGGNSTLIAGPKTDQMPTNEGSSVATIEVNNSGSTIQSADKTIQTQETGVVAIKNANISLGSSVAIIEVNNSGSTIQSADKTIQTQETGVVAIKNENISLGSSVAIIEVNNSGSTIQSADKTIQTQETGVVAIKNENISLGNTSQMKEPETNTTVKNERGVPATIDNIYTDTLHLCKSQLQIYTQKRNISLPVYSYESEGPPHDCRFRCKVTVDGNIYESQEFYHTLQKAEQAAAKVAIMSLFPNGVERDESGYKNLLQEFVQKRGNHFPTYTTIRTGKAHVPTFISKVEVEGECFMGQEARSKKQAELSAAKVAYTTLKQRNLVIESALSGSRLQAEETTHAPSPPSPLASQSDSTGPGLATQQLVSNKRPDFCGNLNENLSCLPPPKRQEVQLSPSRAEYIAFLREHVQPSMPESEKQAEVYPEVMYYAEQGHSSISRSVSSSSGTSFSSLNEFGQSTIAFASNSSSSSMICSSIEHLVNASTTCKVGVVIHPRQSSMSYPSGSAVQPCSNDDWVAVKFTPDSSA